MAATAGGLTVVSPHLDDAALSCGRLLAAHPGSAMLTLLAGHRQPGAPLTEWDASCGFGPGQDVMQARRAEDAAAARRLGAATVWLDELQGTYRSEPADPAALTAALTAALGDLEPEWVAIPLGLYHPDHVLTADAALGLVAEWPGIRWWLYAEIPYAPVHPDLVRERLAAVGAAGLAAREEHPPLGSRLRKLRAVGCYRSQLPALEPWGARRVALADERYWSLSVA